MRPIVHIASLCLLCGSAGADFELKDPALPEEALSPAPSGNAEYTVEGAGVRSCTAYRKARKKGNSMHYIDLNWAKGFISGVNYAHTQTGSETHLGSGLDLESLTSWLNDFCREHPDATLSDASAALVAGNIQ